VNLLGAIFDEAAARHGSRIAIAGAEAVGYGELHGLAREVSSYKVPRRFESLDALPVNSAGKVQKFLLRELARR
jgi:acyl-CoA synthetase (AMP-forming)/AMP-acid ligase II